jgi:hypothetical protein
MKLSYSDKNAFTRVIQNSLSDDLLDALGVYPHFLKKPIKTALGTPRQHMLSEHRRRNPVDWRSPEALLVFENMRVLSDGHDGKYEHEKINNVQKTGYLK